MDFYHSKFTLQFIIIFVIDNNITVKVNATYDVFNTSVYSSQGCRSSTCEGVSFVRQLIVSMMNFYSHISSFDMLYSDFIVTITLLSHIMFD